MMQIMLRSCQGQNAESKTFNCLALINLIAYCSFNTYSKKVSNYTSLCVKQIDYAVKCTQQLTYLITVEALHIPSELHTFFLSLKLHGLLVIANFKKYTEILLSDADAFSQLPCSYQNAPQHLLAAHCSQKAENLPEFPVVSPPKLEKSDHQ